MFDQIYDRDYRAGRIALNDGIDRLFRNLAHGFDRLTAIQFAAPWRGKPSPRVAASSRTRHVVLIIAGVVIGSGASVATALAPFAGA